MADLKGQQLKDRYQTLLTTSATTANPTTGTLQNGDGSNITELSIGGSLGVTGGANLATSSGNVGIGTSSPDNRLTVSGATPYVSVFNTTPGTSASPSFGGIRFYGFLENTNSLVASIDGGNKQSSDLGGILRFSTQLDGGGGLAERMRITSAGNVGIGTDSPAYKLSIQGSGGIEESEEYFYFHSSAVVGSNARAKIRAVGSGGGSGFGGDLRISTRTQANAWNEDAFVVDSGGNVGIGTTIPSNPLTVNGIVSPSTDNARTLGTASLRWSEVFAGNATINTSDANEKQDIAELNEAEQQVATALKGLIRKYRWIESVERKGDEARIHVGVIAQDVAQAFEDAGLDPEKYGVFCKDTWYTKEETYTEQVENPDFDEEAEEGEDNLRMIDGEEQTRTVPCESDDPDATEHVRYGVRYDQLWAFIISAL